MKLCALKTASRFGRADLSANTRADRPGGGRRHPRRGGAAALSAAAGRRSGHQFPHGEQGLSPAAKRGVCQNQRAAGGIGYIAAGIRRGFCGNPV